MQRDSIPAERQALHVGLAPSHRMQEFSHCEESIFALLGRERSTLADASILSYLLVSSIYFLVSFWESQLLIYSRSPKSTQINSTDASPKAANFDRSFSLFDFALGFAQIHSH